jgi:hypothetical protein
VRVRASEVPLVRVVDVGVSKNHVRLVVLAIVLQCGDRALSNPSTSPAPHPPITAAPAPHPVHLHPNRPSEPRIPLRAPVLPVHSQPSSPLLGAIVRAVRPVYVSAERGAKRDPDTHTAFPLGELRIDSSWNRCRSPHSFQSMGKVAMMMKRPIAECGTTESAADGRAIDVRGAARDTGAVVLDDLDGSTRHPARKTATCRAPKVTSTIITVTKVARRPPWSGTHTPDAGKKDRLGAGTAAAGEPPAGGMRERAPANVAWRKPCASA